VIGAELEDAQDQEIQRALQQLHLVHVPSSRVPRGV
jgi:hypothetical protein